MIHPFLALVLALSGSQNYFDTIATPPGFQLRVELQDLYNSHGPVLDFTLTNNTDTPLSFYNTPQIDAESVTENKSTAAEFRTGHCTNDPAARAGTQGSDSTGEPTQPVDGYLTVPAHGSISISVSELLCQYNLQRGNRYSGIAEIGGPQVVDGHASGGIANFEVPWSFKL